MLLYLLRHADAEGIRTTDAARELTAEGQRQAGRSGHFANGRGSIPN